MRYVGLFVAALVSASPVFAQSKDSEAWLLPDAQIVIDPYEGNSIDWDKLVSDKAVKGIIHRAFFGTRRDTKVDARVAEAQRRAIPVGIYTLGRPGDPLGQADLLVKAGKDLGVGLLALDIESLDPKASMSLADAEVFINRVYEKTGRYPLFYTNFSTYRHISRTYGKSSAFAKTPLWIARFGKRHGLDSANVWEDYTLWQFQSELNCTNGQPCLRRVAGTRSDMDVNVFNGTPEELAALFAK